MSKPHPLSPKNQPSHRSRRILLPVLWILLLLSSACLPAVEANSLSTGTPPPAKPSDEPVLTPDAPTAIPTNTAPPSPTATATPVPTFTPTPIPAIRFAVIGDYGSGGEAEEDVAALIESWDVDFIITTGDNNYPRGEAKTIDDNVGRFFHSYIAPYHGEYGEGADQNRFFPTIGNHDWDTDQGKPYLDYFTLPGNERYYDFVWGPVHFFALNSDSREPDGVGASSRQAEWLRERMADSTARWQVVYTHHSPYSSGRHGSIDWIRWPFKEWGAEVLFSGHDHLYERLKKDGLVYFVNGIGGGGIYSFSEPLAASDFRYAEDYGAMLVTADTESMSFQFINRSGEVIDSYALP